MDDNDALRRAFGKALTRAGCEVVELDNGRSALATLAESEFDVVVSDVRMPDMNGVELLQAVHESDPDLPVVLMTGEPDIDTAMMAVKYGACEYLAKPVELAALRTSVERAVELRRSRVMARDALKAQSGERPRDARTLSGNAESWTGSVLAGRYRLGRLLGKGGMGAVYEADREDLGNMRVAIKVMLALEEDRPDLVTRLRREAEALAAIDHPNIVRVLDFQATPGDPPFLVMERLHGDTLSAAVANEGRFSLERAAFVASQVLAALGAAHRVNIVHRDLKPDNVFLTSLAGMADIVKLLDFGIARIVGAPRDSRLTQTGAVVGTPAYMSPEQARGREADARSDLYAVGCMMYEMLAAQPPFGGENYNALIFAVLQGAPTPLATLRPDLDSAFVNVVEKSMAKDPHARFQTAEAMAEALGRWVVPKSIPAAGPRSSPMAFAKTIDGGGRKRRRRPRTR